jgi:hypothetical protein
MAIKDPMALLEEEMNRKSDTSGFKPFFFMLKDGEKALIRPLLNMSQYAQVNKHEYFDSAKKQYVARSICAVDLEQECQLCLDAADNKKLKADSRFVLPIYVLSVKDVKTGKEITYTKDDQEIAVSGVRLLEMKRTSSILRDLVASYNESDEHDITLNDFVISRQNIDGDPLKTKYTVTPKAPKPASFPEEIPEAYRDPEQIKFLFANACEPVCVGDRDKPAEPVAAATPTTSATNGKVKSAPDF